MYIGYFLYLKLTTKIHKAKQMMHFTAIYLFNAHVWDDKRERVYCVFCLFCASTSCFTKLISLPHWWSALNRRVYDPLLSYDLSLKLLHHILTWMPLLISTDQFLYMQWNNWYLSCVCQTTKLCALEIKWFHTVYCKPPCK